MRSRINYLQLNVCFWQVRIWPVCFWQVRIWPKSTRYVSMYQYSNLL